MFLLNFLYFKSHLILFDHFLMNYNYFNLNHFKFRLIFRHQLITNFIIIHQHHFVHMIILLFIEFLLFNHLITIVKFIRTMDPHYK
jgi:hypothetical protein